MKDFKEMDVAASRDFIANCELGECPAHFSRQVLMTSDTNDAVSSAQDVAKGVIVDSSLIAFTPGTSREIIQDVNDCLLLASRAATKLFNPESESAQWFKKYNEVLTYVGWLPAEIKSYEADTSGQSFTMDKIVLDMLETALLAAAVPGPTSVLMLAVAHKMIEKMRTDEASLRLFESRSSHEQSSNFRLGACNESPDGVVNMVIGSVNYSSRTQKTHVLFATWNSGEADVHGASYNLLFNRRHFESVREDVRSKLTDALRKNISEIEL